MKEAVKLKEAFWAWLARGSSEAADRYREVRRTAALMVAEVKTGVWEEFGRAKEKDFRSQGRKEFRGSSGKPSSDSRKESRA